MGNSAQANLILTHKLHLPKITITVFRTLPSAHLIFTIDAFICSPCLWFVARFDYPNNITCFGLPVNKKIA
jgi:hypothetical protein